LPTYPSDTPIAKSWQHRFASQIELSDFCSSRSLARVDFNSNVSSLAWLTHGFVAADSYGLWAYELGNFGGRTCLMSVSGNDGNLISSLAVSVDGKDIVCGFKGGFIGLWHLGERTSLGEDFLITDDIIAVAFAPGRQTVKACDSGTNLYEWNMSTGIITKDVLLPIAAHTAAYSASASLIALGLSEGSIAIVETSSAALVKRLEGQHWSPITALQFSPDDKHIVSCSTQRSVCISDLASKQVLRTIELVDFPKAFAYSRDGEKIAIGLNSGLISVFDTTTGQLWAELAGHIQPIEAVDFSSDGTMVLSSSADCTVRLWDIYSHKRRERSGNVESIETVRFSPDGKHVISRRADSCMIALAVPTRFSTEVDPLVLPTRCSHSFDSYPLLLALDSKKEMRESPLPGPDLTHRWFLEWDRLMSMLAMHSNGTMTTAAVSAFAANIFVGHSSGQIQTFERSKEATTGDECNVLVNASLLKPVGFMHDGPCPVSCIAISEDDRVLAAMYNNGVLKIFNISNTRCYNQHLLIGVSAIALSSDGSFIATGTCEGTVLVWSTTSAPMLLANQICCQRATIKCIAFSADGDMITVGSADSVVRLWKWKNQNNFFWQLETDGWITSTVSGKRLVWIPDDLRSAVQGPGNIVLYSDIGVARMILRDVYLDKNWWRSYYGRYRNKKTATK
jgi:WD40 repeat protein